MAQDQSPEWTEELIRSMPAWTLVQTYHAVAHRFRQLFEELGLTPTQFGVLGQLAIAPGLIQSELARRVLVRPQSIAVIITALEDRGLLTQTGPGGRGRARIVSITDAGRALLDVAIPRLIAFNSPESLGLTEDEQETLNRLLHKMNASFSAAQDDRSSARAAGDRR
ncbi:MarR family winged helix-turn-helix transcriptional regulator [Streptomyces griseorubiginosus]|uniref:MarR family winged helix-turn-helix transcriptional regulator n=1 Tax=Streptomyces griseorubiginosus TaxID=67304 RepID=UPI00113FCA87|nr:MarR family transcriptional regulator [Streptomyces griseorubiginosus]